MPNVMQLDYIKRAFDDIVRDGTDGITRQMSDPARWAWKASRGVRDATREAVPAYGRALELASDSASLQDAHQFGVRILMDGSAPGGTTREMVARAVKDASKPEVAAMRVALRSQIDETLANVRRIASNPMADPEGRELQRALGMLSSRASTEKMQTLLGDDAQLLIQNVDEAIRALGLKAATTRGSQTAGRLITERMVQEEIAPGIIAQSFQGQPINAARTIVQEITGFTPDRMTARSEKVLNEIATILTRSGNVEAMQALKALQSASAAQPVTEKTAYQVARAVTAALAAGSHRLGVPAIEERLVGPR